MAWRYWRDFRYYEPSRPREARGGIKAQSKGGTFGRSWWARRWIQVLESFDIGQRLHRGRSYARRGQVLSIAISKGVVSAEVQGSRPTPYRVRITVATLPKAAWKRLAGALGRQALFPARLLAGEMPEQIEEVFTASALSLFPGKSRDLQTECSCPDWSNPCKHIAAVYYLLGEEFDRDPFLIFRLRGMERQEFLKLLGGRVGPAKKGGRRGAPSPEAGEQADPTPPPDPLSATPGSFWGKDRPGGDCFGEVRIAPAPAALPKRLGGFPFWRGEERLLDALERIYREASVAGMDVFLCAELAGKV
jgi:uncharacterized Zn finger protein